MKKLTVVVERCLDESSTFHQQIEWRNEETALDAVIRYQKECLGDPNVYRAVDWY